MGAIAIIILVLIALVEAVFIFWPFQVLKNTFDSIIPKGFHEAYDSKYYPATVIGKVRFGSPQEMTITDFSMYESHKIVGFTIYTKQTAKEFYGAQAGDMTDEELMEIFNDRPAMFKNAVVYSPMEGFWTWE